MPYSDKKIRVYREQPPTFLMDEYTSFLINFCTEHEIILVDDPETILEFRRYQAETKDGKSGRLLHYIGEDAEMIIFDYDIMH